MPGFVRPLIVVAFLVCGGVALAVAPAGAMVDTQVSVFAGTVFVVTGEAQGVESTTVTLTGTITGPAGTQYRFDFGPTANLGQSSAVGALSEDGTDQPVTASISGLAPSTAYQFTLVAWQPATPEQTTSGETRSFSTTAPPAEPEAAQTPAAPATTAEPAMGETMVVAPVEGTIKVKERGTDTYTPLAAGEEVPVGSVVDSRRGAVKLTSEVTGGRVQTATFGDGLFQVRQAEGRRGLTEIILRGGNFAVCGTRSRRGSVLAGRATGRAASVAQPQPQQRRRKRPKRRLWAKDNGGRFRTHGRNSVATVRGTRWVTTDTCAGTRTTVTSGAVAVRDSVTAADRRRAQGSDLPGARAPVVAQAGPARTLWPRRYAPHVVAVLLAGLLAAAVGVAAHFAELLPGVRRTTRSRCASRRAGPSPRTSSPSSPSTT